MSELRRLRDEADSTVELLLLEAGVSYGSSTDARAKTLAALGLAGSAAVSAGAMGVGTSLLSKLGWTKVLLISGIGAGVVAPVGYLTWNRLHFSPSESAKIEMQGPLSTPQAVPKSVAPAAPVVASTPETASVLAPPAAKSDTKAASSSALAAELIALDAARAELAASDPSGALAKLDDYAHAYPHGHLVLEAEVLRIDALAKSGQADAAKKRAEAFLRRHPNSVLASRVRGYLD